MPNVDYQWEHVQFKLSATVLSLHLYIAFDWLVSGIYKVSFHHHYWVTNKLMNFESKVNLVISFILVQNSICYNMCVIKTI